MEITKRVLNIVEKATELKNKHTTEKKARVNYACFFSQSKKEYNDLIKEAHKLGKIIEKTPTGPLFQINPLKTISGKLQLLKIRAPDSTRKEMGDADFTIAKYNTFKKKVLSKKGFSLISRTGYEMIELVDPAFDVRAYFSNPPIDRKLGLK